MIWFIDNNAAVCGSIAAGCGRLSNPFSSLAAFQTLNNGVGNNPAANDNIFIFESVDPVHARRNAARWAEAHRAGLDFNATGHNRFDGSDIRYDISGNEPRR